MVNLFLATKKQTNMREFSGYCIPSEEYRQKYELEAQQNMELRQKSVLQSNIIAALRKELEASRKELLDKNSTVNDLQTKLNDQKKTTEEWVDKFELQDLKTERAHQRRMEADEKVSRLEKMADALRAELKKANSVQILLCGEVRSLKQKVADQRSVIELTGSVNLDLLVKVGLEMFLYL